MTTAKPNPYTISRDLQAAFLRYIDTAYYMRDAGLRAERRSLLETPRNLSRRMRPVGV
jgi:DEAD/DEAH box helicase domain-containing protein